MSHREPGDTQYLYPSNSGEGVVAYVIDSGIYLEHEEFEGRVKEGLTLVPDEGHSDGTGHGTHVAGTIGSRKYGVAKKVEIISVKVFDKDGKSSGGGSLAGLEWVLTDAQERAQTPGYKGAVINMSLGGDFSQSKNDAVNNAVEAGLHVVVSGGNQHVDSCTRSPGSASGPITVGSSRKDDTYAFLNNYGKCIDVFAPGDKIISTGIDGPNSDANKSGTSMAAPHVTGLIAHFLSVYPSTIFNPTPGEEIARFSVSPFDVVRKALPGFLSTILPQHSTTNMNGVHSLSGPVTPQVMKDAIKELAWKDIISGLPEDTPNLLVYNNYTVDDEFWYGYGF